MKTIGLYLHIPFCFKKCHYCDFTSFANKEHAYQDYVDVLCKEIEQVGHEYEDSTVSTLFIGGGTPSILSGQQLQTIQDKLSESFCFTEDAEITIECNPGTLSDEKIEVLSKGIINRVSLGLQATDSKLLNRLGRIHSYEEFEDNYYKLKKAGIHNINVDMMFGLPDQSVDSYLDGLRKVIALKPEHLSVYSLIIEEKTPFHKAYNSGRLRLPQEEEERAMYEQGKALLQEHGYDHYEISNFAKQGYACRHNIVYWDVVPYIGMGLAAHSFDGEKRYANISDLSTYIEHGQQGQFDKIDVIEATEQSLMEEFMFLGLRKLAGVSVLEFEQRFSKTINQVYGSAIELLTKQGLIVVEGQNLRLTEAGLHVSNRVYSEFLL